MNDEHEDPAIQHLFARAYVTLDDPAFTDRVAAGLSRWHRRSLVLRIVMGLAALALAVTLDDAAVRLAALLTRALVDIDHQFLAGLLAPLNTIAGLMALTVVGVRVLRGRLSG